MDDRVKNADSGGATSDEPGAQVRLKLVPLSKKPEVKGIQPFDDFTDDIEKMILTRYWSEPTTEPSGAGEEATAAPDTARASLFATLACVVATIAVGALALRLKRGGASS